MHAYFSKITLGWKEGVKKMRAVNQHKKKQFWFMIFMYIIQIKSIDKQKSQKVSCKRLYCSNLSGRKKLKTIEQEILKMLKFSH